MFRVPRQNSLVQKLQSIEPSWGPTGAAGTGAAETGAAEAAAAATAPVVAGFVARVVPAGPEVGTVTEEERPAVEGAVEVPTALSALAHLGTTYGEPL